MPFKWLKENVLLRNCALSSNHGSWVQVRNNKHQTKESWWLSMGVDVGGCVNSCAITCRRDGCILSVKRAIRFHSVVDSHFFWVVLQLQSVDIRLYRICSSSFFVFLHQFLNSKLISFHSPILSIFIF
jgi:hypothetical protein